MQCEKHGPWASVSTKTSAFGLGFCPLSPSGHVFHTTWETMIKTYNKYRQWVFRLAPIVGIKIVAVDALASYRQIISTHDIDFPKKYIDFHEIWFP